MKRASLHTLGCRLNQSETAIMSQSLKAHGYDIVEFGEPADLAVINTCTVTAMADAKARNAIRSFLRKNPNAYCAVVGCYSQMGYKAIADIPGVDLIIGNQEKLNLVHYIQAVKNTEPIIIRDTIQRDDFTIDVVGQSEDKTRANLKIQDGCDFMCSFCIIPFARGRSKSRTLANLMEEAEVLVSQGFQEIVLTGVNLGTYAFEGQTICDVVAALNELDGVKRIRISSIEPTTIPDQLFAWMADEDHALVPYLHIPLQSGSDPILQAMQRKYSCAEFLEFISDARNKVPDLCIGTDVMVGFPGETEALFEQTQQFLANAPVNYFHVFSFSVRENTPAERMGEQVSEAEKKRRSAILRELSERKRAEFYHQQLGCVRDVLFEEQEGEYWFGYTDNYVRVAVCSSDDLHNRLRRVCLDKAFPQMVQGHFCD